MENSSVELCFQNGHHLANGLRFEVCASHQICRDQIVIADVQVPTKFSQKARELLEAYATEVGEEIQEHASLASKLKGFFGSKKKGDKEEASVNWFWSK